MTKNFLTEDMRKGTHIDFSVVTIPDWNKLLEEKSAIGPWDHIVQLDSEYTVTDGLTGGEVPAISGVIQQKEETVGIFEIRPASGLILGIDFKDIQLVHKVWTAFNSVKHFGHGGSRQEWWNIPLKYGETAKILSGSIDSGTNQELDLSEEKEYDDVKDYLLKSSILNLPDYSSLVHMNSTSKFYFEGETPSSLSDVSELSQLLEKMFIDTERRNQNRESVF